MVFMIKYVNKVLAMSKGAELSCKIDYAILF